MKKMRLLPSAVLAANLLLVAVFCQAQTEADCTKISFKTYNDSTGNYLIKYEYNGCWFSRPATYPEGEPHYDAVVTVYKIVSCKCFVPKNDTLIVGKSFAGTYVEKGCFEDVPEYNVSQAKKLQLEAVKQNGH